MKPVTAIVVLLVIAGGCRPAADAPATGRASADRSPLPVAGRVDPEGGVTAADTPFVLRDQTGAEFSSESLRGKVWMGSVFFANCPGPCFRENQAIAEILGKITDPDFLVVSLTCDPDNDTPDVLRRYADRFEADVTRWKFLTGDMDTIRQVANKTFLLTAEVGVHSERGVVFDRRGRLRGGYHLLQPDRVVLLEQLIRDVLAEREPAEPQP